LLGRVEYARRDRASELLISVGRRLAKAEQAGESLEACFFYPSGDGDWVGVLLLQGPGIESS
jgi:hypothetical protein